MLWQSPKKFPNLKDNQVHIWKASVACLMDEKENFLEVLSKDERKRASRFIAKKDSDSFIVARGVLRFLISEYSNLAPEDIVFQQNEYGKLYLEGSPLQFNLSHSKDSALFIFSLDNQVGIDVEFMKEIDNFSQIAEKFFSKKEVKDLLSLPEEDRKQAFFNCWSRKEAFIKAKGLGVYHGLDNFSVEVSSRKEGKIELFSSLRAEGEAIQENKDIWSLEAIDPGKEYAGAFVINKLKYFVELYDF